VYLFGSTMAALYAAFHRRALAGKKQKFSIHRPQNRVVRLSTLTANLVSYLQSTMTKYERRTGKTCSVYV
jgi:hypothetical protein